MKKHELLNCMNVCDYVRSQTQLFMQEDELIATEIGDGNINYVFKVQCIKKDKSVIVKQADIYLRASGRLLDVIRSEIEAQALLTQYAITPQFIPKVYAVDPILCTIIMEDISEYENMRYALLENKQFPKFSQQMATYMAYNLLLTSDIVLSRSEKRKNAAKFLNIEMCDISECLVLNEPFTNDRNRNVISEGNEQFVNINIYQDESLKLEVAKLYDAFMNQSQALLHGDLHTGSIFVTTTGLKVIDPEFATYGPMGYDIGNVIANLFFAYARQVIENPSQMHNWLAVCIEETLQNTMDTLETLYKEKVVVQLYKSDAYRKQYLNRVFQQSLGYAGCEIIRRTIGDSKVKELESMPLTPTKIQLERVLLNWGITLIKEGQSIHCAHDMMHAFDVCIRRKETSYE